MHFIHYVSQTRTKWERARSVNVYKTDPPITTKLKSTVQKSRTAGKPQHALACSAALSTSADAQNTHKTCNTFTEDLSRRC